MLLIAFCTCQLYMQIYVSAELQEQNDQRYVAEINKVQPQKQDKLKV